MKGQSDFFNLKGLIRDHRLEKIALCVLTSVPETDAALAWTHSSRSVSLSPIDLTHLYILRTEAWRGLRASEEPAGTCGQLVHGGEAVDRLFSVLT